VELKISIFKEGPSVAKVITGGGLTYILAMLGGMFVWIFGVIFTRSDIGLGQEAFGIYITGQAIIVLIGCFCWGMNQSIQKHVSEYLVSDKNKAELYGRNGAIAIIIFATCICFFCVFLGISLLNLNSILAFLLFLIGPSVLISSIKDGMVGNIAAVQRFDNIAIINIMSSLGTFLIGTPLILLVIKPHSTEILQLAPLTMLGLTFGFALQVILAWYFGRKSLPFEMKKLYRGPKDRRIIWKIAKYGFYCAIPTFILSGTVLWIPAILMAVILGTTTPGLYGVIMGYAMVMITISYMGWPMISAVSEAYAMNNRQLIDDYFRNNFKSSFNLIALILTIYIGLAKPILEFIHGPEYSSGYLPFIILSLGVSLMALEFICCSVIIGVGAGRKAAYIVIATILIEIFLTILFLYIFPLNFISFAAPCAILISSLTILPVIPRLLKPYISSRFPRGTLLKGCISILIAVGIGYLIDYFVFSFTSFIGIITGLILMIVIYIFSMLFLAGYDEEDFKLINDSLNAFNIRFLKRLVETGEKITHKSPFYRKPDENGNSIS
jgi:O-antigen/teichoic acid export membrane protein